MVFYCVTFWTRKERFTIAKRKRIDDAAWELQELNLLLRDLWNIMDDLRDWLDTYTAEEEHYPAETLDEIYNTLNGMYEARQDYLDYSDPPEFAADLAEPADMECADEQN